MLHGNAFGRVCLSVCPIPTLTFTSFGLETVFWYVGTDSEDLVRVSRSSGQGQGYRSKKVKLD